MKKLILALIVLSNGIETFASNSQDPRWIAQQNKNKLLDPIIKSVRKKLGLSLSSKEQVTESACSVACHAPEESVPYLAEILKEFDKNQNPEKDMRLLIKLKSAILKLQDKDLDAHGSTNERGQEYKTQTSAAIEKYKQELEVSYPNSTFQAYIMNTVRETLGKHQGDYSQDIVNSNMQNCDQPVTQANLLVSTDMQNCVSKKNQLIIQANLLASDAREEDMKSLVGIINQLKSNQNTEDDKKLLPELKLKVSNIQDGTLLTFGREYKTQTLIKIDKYSDELDADDSTNKNSRNKVIATDNDKQKLERLTFQGYIMNNVRKTLGKHQGDSSSDI